MIFIWLSNWLRNRLVGLLHYRRHIFIFQPVRGLLERLVLSDYKDDKKLKLVGIQLVDACNYHCQHCPRKFDFEETDNRWKYKHVINYMNVGLYHRIINELKTIHYDQTICLTESDESTIRKDFVELAIYASLELPLAEIRIVTNGSLMTKEDYLQLIKRPNVFIFIDTYNVQKVIDKVKAWPKNNRCEIRHYKTPSALFNWAGALPSRFKLPLKQPCWRPSAELIIHYDGTVKDCALNYYEGFVGDLNKQTIMEIWNGNAIQKHRELLKNNIRDGACRNCDYFGEISHYKNEIRQNVV